MNDKRSAAAWVVVANQELARFFARETKRGELVEVRRLEHPAGQLAGRDLVTDRPGRTFDSAGEGRHGMEPPTDPKEQEAQRFAKEIADAIEDGRTADRFSSLVLVAGPAFLGLLRQSMSGEAAKLVEREVTKNLYQHDAAEIRELIADQP